MNRVQQLCQLWVTWNLQKALAPAGGTPMKGSAHPKGDRSPGVARNLRLNHRTLRIGRPLVKYAVSTKLA